MRKSLNAATPAIEALEARSLFAAAVSGFTLINADTDRPIATLADGAVINLSTLPTRNLNVLTNANDDTGSVKLSLDGALRRIESTAPFALEGNDGPDFYAWTPAAGSHVITATPYTLRDGGGDPGATVTVHFSVVTSSQTSRMNVSATPVGTSGVVVTWETPESIAQSVARYRVT